MPAAQAAELSAIERKELQALAVAARQHGPLLDGINGTAAGMERLDGMGWIKEGPADYLMEDFCGQRIFVVGVHCATEELIRRKQARGNRKSGLAASQAVRIHENCAYDFSIDTTESSPATCVGMLLDWWQQSPEPRAFNHMCTRCT